jgi:uncharacterized protein (UPF0261 family)
MQKSLLVLTTLDTKGEEAGFVAEWIRRTGSKLKWSTSVSGVNPDYPPIEPEKKYWKEAV